MKIWFACHTVAGRGALLAFGLIAALTISACGSSPPDDTAAEPPAPVPTETGPTVNERGAIPKPVGEQAGVHSDTEGAPDTLAFTVRKIEVDPICDVKPGDAYYEDAKPVAGGHFVAMTIDLQTGPDYQALGGTAISAADYVGADGYSVESGANSWPSYLCAGDARLSSTMQPGSKYRGVMMLNVPSVPGKIILTDGRESRWEYDIPATGTA